MKTTIYLLYRHGSNAANQSMTPVAVVGYEEAVSREAACRQMARQTTVYANQFLTAKPLSRTSQADRERADEAERARMSEMLTAYQP
jgi:hypothetical protein